MLRNKPISHQFCKSNNSDPLLSGASEDSSVSLNDKLKKLQDKMDGLMQDAELVKDSIQSIKNDTNAFISDVLSNSMGYHKTLDEERVLNKASDTEIFCASSAPTFLENEKVTEDFNDEKTTLAIRSGLKCNKIMEFPEDKLENHFVVLALQESVWQLVNDFERLIHNSSKQSKSKLMTKWSELMTLECKNSEIKGFNSTTPTCTSSLLKGRYILSNVSRNKPFKSSIQGNVTDGQASRNSGRRKALKNYKRVFSKARCNKKCTCTRNTPKIIKQTKKKSMYDNFLEMKNSRTFWNFISLVPQREIGESSIVNVRPDQKSVQSESLNSDIVHHVAQPRNNIRTNTENLGSIYEDNYISGEIRRSTIRNNLRNQHVSNLEAPNRRYDAYKLHFSLEISKEFVYIAIGFLVILLCLIFFGGAYIIYTHQKNPHPYFFSYFWGNI